MKRTREIIIQTQAKNSLRTKDLHWMSWYFDVPNIPDLTKKRCKNRNENETKEFTNN